MRLKHTLLPSILLALVACFPTFSTAHAQQAALEQSAIGSTRIAAGAYLPVTVKLTNFGSALRVDVQVTYTITNAEGVIVYTESNTVAVDTTASFVKQLLVPTDAPPGVYTAESNIIYPDQTAPARSSFEFRVERTFMGLFVSDLLRYGALAFALGSICFFIGRLFFKGQSRRSLLIEYSDKPKADRIYYEIVSDTIAQMRQRVGDAALDIAAQIEGLEIDEKTGRVLTLTKSPADIVARLVSGYEKKLGKTSSFSLRRKSKL